MNLIDRTVAQLREIAAARGIHVPSKATKAQIVAALPSTFDREARDALRRRPVALFESDGVNRHNRRHRPYKKGGVWYEELVGRRWRKPATSRPVTRLDLLGEMGKVARRDRIAAREHLAAWSR